jgi:hypothetical protein
MQQQNISTQSGSIQKSSISKNELLKETAKVLQ